MKKQCDTSSFGRGKYPGHSAPIGVDFFIREATLDDAAIIWQTIYDNRDYLRTWLPFVDGLKEVSDEEAFLEEQLSVPYKERNIVFVIGQGHELCGLIGFLNTDIVNCRTEIGYWLIPEYQGLGVMTSCVRHLCEWAVSERGMNSIRIRCAVGNLSSNAIPCRLGFTLEGIERDGELMADGKYTDLCVYSILKSEMVSMFAMHGKP